MSEINLKGLTLKEEKPNKVRQDGFVPSILYGRESENKRFKVKMGEFIKVYNNTSESTLIDLQIDDEKSVKCLIKDIQKNVLTGDFLHIDFYQVKMGEKITTEIPLNIIGESNAVKNLDGILNVSLSSIEIECLPSNLKDEIDIDISTLESLDDYIRIEDIKFPEGITCTLDPQSVVVSINIAQEEEPEEELTVDDVEVESESKKDKTEEESVDDNESEENKEEKKKD